MPKPSWKRNDTWQGAVHNLMREGYGVEDIDVRLRADGFHCTLAAVRAEAQILREEGRLDALYRGRP